MLPVVSIVASLIIILVLMRYHVSVALAIFVGAVISALGTGCGFDEVVAIAKETIIHPTTIELALTIGFISALGNLMGKVGMLGSLVDSLQRLFKDTRYIIVALPSLISMLMVPGGAILSAPLVGEVGIRKKLTPAQMTTANIIFRHIWQLVFPLFPSMILAARLADVSPGTIISFNFPLVIIVFIITFKVIFPKNGMKNNNYNGWDPKAIISLFKAVFPMLLAIILALGLGLYFPLALVCGIIVVYIYQWREKKLSPVIFGRWTFGAVSWSMVVAIFSIMFFKDVLAAGGGVDILGGYFLDLGVPLWVLLIGIPFISGFATGSNTVNIAIAFPFFLPLIPEATRNVYIGFMFCICVIGYLVSPLHLCLILTREHFGASLGDTYRLLLIPVIAIVTLATLLFFLLT